MDELERAVRRIAPAVLRLAVGVAGDRDAGAEAVELSAEPRRLAVRKRN